MTGGLACCGQEFVLRENSHGFQAGICQDGKNPEPVAEPQQISGVSARLMCCLAYEHDVYESSKKGFPVLARP